MGVIFFSDRIEKFIPPKKGRRHILRIIRELLTLRPEGRHTDVGAALEYLAAAIKRRAVAFVLSDFIDGHDYSKALSIAARKHDVAAIRVYDRRMAELPDVGLIKVTDAETGHEQYVDTSSRRIREAHRKWWADGCLRLEKTLGASMVDHVTMATDDDYVRALMNLFAKRRR